MHNQVFAALGATVGFAVGDVFTALLTRKVNARSAMFLLTMMRLVLYMPFIVVWQREFGNFNASSLEWTVLLSAVFTAAYLGFIKAMEVGRNPALVGVVAGCFPASASFIAVTFLGQRPTWATILLLLAVLVGVTLIGLPDDWHESLQPDKGILLALLPLVGWGVFGALVHEPVQLLHSPHAWFVVQTGVAAGMLLVTIVMYNKDIPRHVRDVARHHAWKFALPAGMIIGLAEAVQAFALGSGKQLIIIETLLGSYPAVYFLIAHKVFREPIGRRQWVGILAVVVSIAVLSSGG